MKLKMEQQMKKGALEMLVLKLLEQEAKYGYQMISELREKSGDTIILKEGTLYPILYRLEDDMLVKSYWNEPKGREISRKYYAITEEGKAALSEMYHIWCNFTEQVKNIMEEGQ